MIEKQLLNSLQGTGPVIDPYSVKKEALDEYRIDTVEERLTRIEDKVDLLIMQLKIEFYKNDETPNELAQDPTNSPGDAL